MNIESKKWFYILITVILITEYSDKFAGKVSFITMVEQKYGDDDLIKLERECKCE